MVEFKLVAIADSVLAVLYTQECLFARSIACDLHSHSLTS